MLAENVRVNVFGKIGKGFFSAYVSGNSFSNKSAYLVTRKDRVEEYFDGVVIAVAKFEGLKGDKFIVAPYGEIYYEPELKKILARLRNVKVESISCLYEKSCGAVIFTATSRIQRYCL